MLMPIRSRDRISPDLRMIADRRHDVPDELVRGDWIARPDRVRDDRSHHELARRAVMATGEHDAPEEPSGARDERDGGHACPEPGRRQVGAAGLPPQGRTGHRHEMPDVDQALSDPADLSWLQMGRSQHLQESPRHGRGRGAPAADA